jgi:hypothetical protein
MCLFSGGTHFTPKGVSIRASPVATNIEHALLTEGLQPLRGCCNPSVVVKTQLTFGVRERLLWDSLLQPLVELGLWFLASDVLDDSA